MLPKSIENFKSTNNRLIRRSQKSKIYPFYSASNITKLPNTSKLKNGETFNYAMKPIIIFSQLFGMFPIEGVSSSDPTMMTFKFKSFKTYYSLFIVASILCIFVTMVVLLVQAITSGAPKILDPITHVVFFGSNLMVVMFFFLICQTWITLQKKWAITEIHINSFCDENSQLRFKLIAISVTMMSAATVEHSLNYFNTKEDFSMSKDLSVLYNHFAKAYNLEKSYDVSVISYWRFAAVLFLYIINKISTIQWNFTDVFIVVVTTGLAEKYKYLNKSVIRSLRKERDEIYWLQCREKYAMLSDLVKETDKTISPLILVSYFINLYIICIQLYNGIFITADGTLAYVYFFASFLFIISRITAVTIAATRIHSQSKTILSKIYCCSPSSFTREAERLQYQLTADEVSMTGMNFFSITRSFVFTLVGTIITYEVVLLQVVKH